MDFGVDEIGLEGLVFGVARNVTQIIEFMFVFGLIVYSSF